MAETVIAEIPLVTSTTSEQPGTVLYGYCSSTQYLNQLTTFINSILSIILTAIEGQYAETVKIPGVAPISLTHPGVDLPGYAGVSRQGTGRIPRINRAYVGNVVPSEQAGGKRQYRFGFSGAEDLSLPGQTITIPGIDPLDQIFRATQTNFEILQRYLAGKGLELPLSSILGQIPGSCSDPSGQTEQIQEITQTARTILNVLGNAVCIPGSINYPPLTDSVWVADDAGQPYVVRTVTPSASGVVININNPTLLTGVNERARIRGLFSFVPFVAPCTMVRIRYSWAFTQLVDFPVGLIMPWPGLGSGAITPIVPGTGASGAVDFTVALAGFQLQDWGLLYSSLNGGNGGTLTITNIQYDKS